jgi:hypothetical protein
VPDSVLRLNAKQAFSGGKYRGRESHPSIQRPAFHGISQHQETPWTWFEIVERYSRCQLTRGDDKLVAIAGLAQRI